MGPPSRESANGADRKRASASADASDSAVQPRRSQPRPAPIAKVGAADEGTNCEGSGVSFHFSPFTLRCLARELDPSLELTDSAAERLLVELDDFMARVLRHAKARQSGTAIGAADTTPASSGAVKLSRGDIAASVRALYDIDLPASPLLDG